MEQLNVCTRLRGKVKSRIGEGANEREGTRTGKTSRHERRLRANPVSESRTLLQRPSACGRWRRRTPEQSPSPNGETSRKQREQNEDGIFCHTRSFGKGAQYVHEGDEGKNDAGGDNVGLHGKSDARLAGGCVACQWRMAPHRLRQPPARPDCFLSHPGQCFHSLLGSPVIKTKCSDFVTDLDWRRTHREGRQVSPAYTVVGFSVFRRPRACHTVRSRDVQHAP